MDIDFDLFIYTLIIEEEIRKIKVQRWLEKRKKRNFRRRIMYKNKSISKINVPRIGGKFIKTDFKPFVSITQINP